MNEKELDTLRDYLNEIVDYDNICLHDGEILFISQRLDQVINEYYIFKGMQVLNA